MDLPKRSMRAMRPISELDIARVMLSLGIARPRARHRYQEIAHAFARASNDDPLFTESDAGHEATACLLVASAWEASRLDPTLRVKSRYGLFQIRPPLHATLTTNALFAPRTSALFAIDMMRESVRRLHARPWSERLAWQIDVGTHDGPADARPPSAEAFRRSVTVMTHAQKLYQRWFSARTGEALAVVPPSGSTAARPTAARPATASGSVRAPAARPAVRPALSAMNLKAPEARRAHG